MADNFEEEALGSESSLPNLSEEELLHPKEGYEDLTCNNDCGLLEGDLTTCTSCNLKFHTKCLLENELGLCAKCFNSFNTTNEELPLEEKEEPVKAEDVAKEAHSGDLVDSGRENELSDSNKGPAKRELSEHEKSPIKILDEKKKKKPTTEGSNFATKINVGFNHQVPFTPAFFLDHSYTANNNQRQEWARLMYSPYQMEKIRRRKLKEGSDSVIKNEFELAEFIQMCAKSWKNSPGWHPFSPEFAYKILHFADYDPNKALKFMNDPSFNFSCVCDPPTRRYDNKWKPKDRRGQVPTNPYPPPVTLRGYLLRRHTVNK